MNCDQVWALIKLAEKMKDHGNSIDYRTSSVEVQSNAYDASRLIKELTGYEFENVKDISVHWGWLQEPPEAEKNQKHLWIEQRWQIDHNHEDYSTHEYVGAFVVAEKLLHRFSATEQLSKLAEKCKSLSPEKLEEQNKQI